MSTAAEIIVGAGMELPTRRPQSVRQRIVPIRARYDAATITDENSRHWAMADSYSARRANSPEVRERLRNHSRYEVANNCYARGIVNTLADVVIGYGAVLQLPRRTNSDAAKQVERLFADWAAEVDLWGKLWTARVAKAQDGEAFALLRTNPRLDSMVQLDLQLIEAEQVTHGNAASFAPDEVDGLEVDDLGQPTRYFVLREHPGDNLGLVDKPEAVPAAGVLHWYRVDRPGQLRGVPEIMPALPLFAQLRRYTLATLTAAETAADLAAIIYTDLPADETETEPLERIEFERGAMLTMPDGRKVTQLKAEHPTTTYAEFKREILAEIGRALNMPRAIALADASNYNYASGRLDRQGFDRTVENERDQCERQVLAKIWRAWLAEAELIPGYLPAGWYGLGIRPRWLWRQLGHVDRAKEATGAAQELANMTTTLAEECAREGRDWEDVLEELAAEKRRKEELGLLSGTAGEPSNEGANEDEEEPADAEA